MTKELQESASPQHTHTVFFVMTYNNRVIFLFCFMWMAYDWVI